LALQEVENPYFNFCPDSLQQGLIWSQNLTYTIGNVMFPDYGIQAPAQMNRNVDIDALYDFFAETKYKTSPNGIVQKNNQLLFFFYKDDAVEDVTIESTILTSNFKKTKGALAVSCSYRTNNSRVLRRLCFISAHLSACSDLDQNPDPSRHTYFLRRVDDMYDILHECDRWYKRIHSMVETEFLPFNIILEGDLNFRMIKKSQNQHFDEGEIVLRNFGFNEIPKKFRQTYRFKKQDQYVKNTDRLLSIPIPLATYDNKRSSSWTDRVSFHNSTKSQTTIKQTSYRILDDHESPSDHLPVYSTFDIQEFTL
jgi:hypothetical protein